MHSEINELPPEEIKGKGIPVIGKRRIFMPMCTIAWKEKVARKPTIKYVPRVFLTATEVESDQKKTK